MMRVNGHNWFYDIFDVFDQRYGTSVCVCLCNCPTPPHTHTRARARAWGLFPFLYLSICHLNSLFIIPPPPHSLYLTLLLKHATRKKKGIESLITWSVALQLFESNSRLIWTRVYCEDNTGNIRDNADPSSNTWNLPILIINPNRARPLAYHDKRPVPSGIRWPKREARDFLITGHVPTQWHQSPWLRVLALSAQWAKIAEWQTSSVGGQQGVLSANH